MPVSLLQRLEDASDAMDLESDLAKSGMVQDVTAVEDEGRLHHGSVESLIV